MKTRNSPPCPSDGTRTASDQERVGEEDRQERCDGETVLNVTKPFLVQTDNSIWIVEPGRYMRMPREEGPRPPTQSLDGALDDLRWVAVREARIVETPLGVRLRLIPANRPPGANGVLSGIIANVAPTDFRPPPHEPTTDPAGGDGQTHGDGDDLTTRAVGHLQDVPDTPSTR